jgi:hypothetical protein
MNQSPFRPQLSGQPQESQRVPPRFPQAGPKKPRTMSVRVKVALLGVVALLTAVIISSCGGTSGDGSSSATATPSPTPNIPLKVYVGGLASQYSLNTDTSNRQQGWQTEKDGTLTLVYPPKQEWGTMFITDGQPALPGHRLSLNLSTYHSVVADMRAERNGQCVRIGIKDKDQPDNGGETTLPQCLTTSWATVKLPLNAFVGADLTKLYVVFEVAFQGSSSVTVQLRNIGYSLAPASPTPTPPPLTPVSNPFNVYTDAGAPENHYVPTGFMGDFGAITMTEDWLKNPHSGIACIQVKYTGETPQNQGWAGVYWQDPPRNWGKALEPTGYNLSHLSQLSFWVRGDQGNERIKFLVGGITGPYGDSLTAVSKTITLRTSWQLETIDLRGKNLTHVIGGFAWVASKTDNPQGATFYLDDIVFT